MKPMVSMEQKQQLKITPQMLQSFELMMLPLTELETRISEAIETNPALEIPENHGLSYEAVLGRHDSSSDNADDSLSDSSSYGSDTFSERIHTRADGSAPSDFQGYDDEAMERQSQVIEGVLTQKVSLQEHLLDQLDLQKLSEREKHLAELVITNLDSNGFHTIPPLSLEDNLTEDELAPIITMVQGFDPSGIAVEDFRESLVVQARNDGLEGMDLEMFKRLVYDGLDMMKNGQEKVAARKLDIPLDDLKLLYTYLKTLTPFPGQAYNSEPDQFILPDLSIHLVDGSLEMKLNDDALPTLTLNPEFTGLAQTLKPRGAGDKETREASEYIQRMVREASSLINQVQLRNQTLQKVGLTLIKLQSDFFFRGPQYLKPMTLKDVAVEVGVHETTISRISQAKWIDTDWGILPLKQFFGTGVAAATTDGQDLSRNSVKSIIQEIIENNTGKPLSDQKISDMLAERNISVARRTVAKYRKELDIDSSFGR